MENKGTTFIELLVLAVVLHLMVLLKQGKAWSNDDMAHGYPGNKSWKYIAEPTLGLFDCLPQWLWNSLSVIGKVHVG